MAIACLAWSLLAAFVHLERDPGERELAMAVAAGALVTYLLTIGYAIYYRAYWARPPAGGRRRRPLGPLARWMLTIATVGGFGLVVGIAFPDVTRTFAGRLFLMTATLGGVAFGLVWTVGSATPAKVATGEGAASPAPPPTFARSALRLAAWWVGSMVAAAVLFGPGYLVHQQFRSRVDIPACQAACATHASTFDSLIVGKSTYNCNCVGPGGRRTLHDRAYVGGGRGIAAALLDWAVRAGAIVGVTLIWLAALLVGVARLWPRGRRLLRRGKS